MIGKCDLLNHSGTTTLLQSCPERHTLLLHTCQILMLHAVPLTCDTIWTRCYAVHPASQHVSCTGFACNASSGGPLVCKTSTYQRDDNFRYQI